MNEKQLKNEVYKFRFNSKERTEILKNNKSVQIFQKSVEDKHFFIDSVFQDVLSLQTENKLKKKIVIRVTPNNIFCTLFELVEKKNLYVFSAGKCKIKISKKMLPFNSKIMLQSFFTVIKEQQLITSEDSLIVELLGPIKLRKFILEDTYLNFKKNEIIFFVRDKKCFNGCRPKKKRRKKQNKFRILK